MNWQQALRLQDLRAEGRMCDHARSDGGACLGRAVYRIHETVTDTIRGQQYGPTTFTGQYCRVHWRRMQRVIAGRATLDDHDATIVVEGEGYRQVQVFHLDTLTVF